MPEAGHWLALTVALSTVLASAAGVAGVTRTVQPQTTRRVDGPPRRLLLQSAYPEILFARPPPVA